MKKIYLIILASLITSVTPAQNEKKQLKNKDWCYTSGDEINDQVIVHFTDSIRLKRFKGVDDRAKQPYYLSEVPETSFDISRVGSSSGGKYIITQSLYDPTKATASKICKLSENHFSFRIMMKGNTQSPLEQFMVCTKNYTPKEQKQLLDFKPRKEHCYPDIWKEARESKK